MPHLLFLCLMERWLSQQKHTMATILSLCFHGLLRINEALGLLIADISFPGPTSLTGGIRLLKTKTGRNQSILITDPLTWKLLNFQCQRQNRSRRVFSVTYKQFLRALQSCLKEVNVETTFTCHSLRHGGATHLYLAGTRVEDIAQKGRWVSHESLSRYLQSGRSLLLAHQLPSAIQHRGKQLLRDSSILNGMVS